MRVTTRDRVHVMTGLFEVALRLSRKDGLTLRDIGKLYAEGVLLPHRVGTPTQIADRLEGSFKNGETDGFIVSPAYLPSAFAEFFETVVPELQRRGLFRKEYTGNTLRDNLGLGKANLTPFSRKLEPVGVRRSHPQLPL